MSPEAPRRVMIVAGEASGDLHASHLVESMRRLEPSLSFFGFGGERMAAAGVELVSDLTAHQAVGYVEVLRSVPALAYQFLRARRLLASRRPDLLVVIDFPTFNVPLAEHARHMGIPVHYFIPPKVWGWKKHRARKVARAAAKIFTIFPFEADYFSEHGGRPYYFGHPLVDFARPRQTPEAFRRAHGFELEGPLLALLPGSRRQEVNTMLLRYLEVARRLREAGLARQFVIPKAITVRQEWLDRALGDARYAGLGVKVVEGEIHDCLGASTLALATCGTVTLEAALCGCPMVIAYDVGALTRWLFRDRHRFVFFGLPNIVGGHEICPERVGEDSSAERLYGTASRLLCDPSALQRQREELAEVAGALGSGGVFDSVAREMLGIRRVEAA